MQDPADFNVKEAAEYAETLESSEAVEAFIEAERDGKDRTTLIESLEGIADAKLEAETAPNDGDTDDDQDGAEESDPAGDDGDQAVTPDEVAGDVNDAPDPDVDAQVAADSDVTPDTLESVEQGSTLLPEDIEPGDVEQGDEATIGAGVDDGFPGAEAGATAIEDGQPANHHPDEHVTGPDEVEDTGAPVDEDGDPEDAEAQDFPGSDTDSNDVIADDLFVHTYHVVATSPIDPSQYEAGVRMEAIKRGVTLDGPVEYVGERPGRHSDYVLRTYGAPVRS